MSTPDLATAVRLLAKALAMSAPEAGTTSAEWEEWSRAAEECLRAIPADARTPEARIQAAIMSTHWPDTVPPSEAARRILEEFPEIGARPLPYRNFRLDLRAGSYPHIDVTMRDGTRIVGAVVPADENGEPVPDVKTAWCNPLLDPPSDPSD